MWEVMGTDEFATWYQSLTEEQAGAIDARVDMPNTMARPSGVPCSTPSKPAATTT